MEEQLKQLKPEEKPHLSRTLSRENPTLKSEWGYRSQSRDSRKRETYADRARERSRSRRDKSADSRLYVKEQNYNKRILNELQITKDELTKSYRENIELKANLMVLQREKKQLDRKATKLEEELKRCQSHLIPDLKQKLMRLETKIKTKALGSYECGEKIRRTTSITSLTGGRGLMMMTNDCGEALDQDGHDSSREDAAGFDGQQQTGNRFDTDTENHLVCVPDERGEKMIKNYRWPKSSSVEFETWRRLMLDNISSAQRNGISDHIINNSLEQYLLTQDNLINEYARLKQTVSTATLDGTKELITNLNVDESLYGPEERFRQVVSRKGETAMKYLGRLICQFRELYGKNAAGEMRRIKQQFVDGFIIDGHPLDPEDKRLCEVHGDLNDMAIYAEKQMSKKFAKPSSMRNSYARENINTTSLNSNGLEGKNNQYYHPINMMDQAQYKTQNQQIHPPSPSPPP